MFKKDSFIECIDVQIYNRIIPNGSTKLKMVASKIKKLTKIQVGKSYKVTNIDDILHMVSVITDDGLTRKYKYYRFRDVLLERSTKLKHITDIIHRSIDERELDKTWLLEWESIEHS